MPNLFVVDVFATTYANNIRSRIVLAKTEEEAKWKVYEAFSESHHKVVVREVLAQFSEDVFGTINLPQPKINPFV